MIELRTLGRLDLRDAAGTEIRSVLQQPKRLALLAFLAIAAPHRYHRRDILFAMFWPESDEEHARAALRRSLHFLRSALGAATIVGRGEEEICVSADQLWCDAVACDEALRSGNLTAGQELYCGDLLEGFHVSDAPEFQDWLDRERERLRDSVARAAWSLAEAAERAHQGEEAGRWGRRALELTPEDQRARDRLLILLDRIGDRSGAIHADEDLAHHVAIKSDFQPAPAARRPADRLRRVDEVLQRPETIAKPNGATVPAAAKRAPPRRRGWHLLAGAAIALALALSAIVLRRSGAGTSLDPNLLAVAPFDALGGELGLWREGLVDLLSRDLDGAGPLRTVSPTVVIRRWTGRADPVSASALGRRTGAGITVFGGLVAVGRDSVRLTATILDVGRDRTVGEVQLRGDTRHMDQLADSLTVSLLRELKRTRDITAVRTASLRSTSLPALKAFLEGEQHFRRGAGDPAQNAYRRALAHDSTLVPAIRHLAWANEWSGRPSMEDYLLRAGELNHGLPRRDSLLVAGESLYSALSNDLPAPLRQSLRRRQFATLEQGTRFYPDDPEMWYILGELRFHTGWEARVSPLQMLDAFDRSIALDSSFSPAYIHAITLALALYGLEGWNRYARPYLALRPSDEHSSATRLLDAIWKSNPAQPGKADSIIRASNLDQTIDAMIDAWHFPDSAETAVRLGRALVGSHGHSAGFLDDPVLRREALAGVLGLRGHLREAWKLIEGDDQPGWLSSRPGEIALATGSHPHDADALFAHWLRRGPIWPAGEPPGPLLFALPWWAARRDTLALAHYARRADSAQRATSRPIEREIARYGAGAASAYSSLARGDTAAALRRFETLPHDVELGALDRVTEGQILVHLGRDAEALELFEGAFPIQWWGPARVLARLGAAGAAERLGEWKRARAHYQFVIDVWRHADAELEPYVREARAGLERLAPER